MLPNNFNSQTIRLKSLNIVINTKSPKYENESMVKY